MKRLGGVVAILAALALAGAGVIGLAEATMSRHEATPPDSATVVAGDARVRGAAEHGLGEMAHALFLTCRLEVEADVVEESFHVDGGGRFEARLRPALDESDERQLHGCLEDARVDSLQVEISRLERVR